MSKSKESLDIDMQLSQIEPVGFGLTIPDGFKPSQGFQFSVFLESFIHSEKKRLIVTNRVDILSRPEASILGHFVAKYHFDLIGIEQLKQSKNGKHLIPGKVQYAVNTIALSTTRGLMYAQFTGTYLQGAILPLIDPADFSVNEVEN